MLNTGWHFSIKRICTNTIYQKEYRKLVRKSKCRIIIVLFQLSHVERDLCKSYTPHNFTFKPLDGGEFVLSLYCARVWLVLLVRCSRWIKKADHIALVCAILFIFLHFHPNLWIEVNCVVSFPFYSSSYHSNPKMYVSLLRALFSFFWLNELF